MGSPKYQAIFLAVAFILLAVVPCDGGLFGINCWDSEPSKCDVVTFDNIDWKLDSKCSSCAVDCVAKELASIHCTLFYAMNPRIWRALRYATTRPCYCNCGTFALQCHKLHSF